MTNVAPRDAGILRAALRNAARHNIHRVARPARRRRPRAAEYSARIQQFSARGVRCRSSFVAAFFDAAFLDKRSPLLI
jgi:hypothetical protein